MRHRIRSNVERYRAKAPFQGAAAARASLAAFVAAGTLCTVLQGEARAGCGDGACGRIDWTEVTEMDQGAPAAAKLHGNYAWRRSARLLGHASAGRHGLGLRLADVPFPERHEMVCRGWLATEMAKAGTSAAASVTCNQQSQPPILLLLLVVMSESKIDYLPTETL